MRNEIKIGLSLVSAIGLLYLAVVWIKFGGAGTADRKVYLCHFESVNGLRTGDPVQVRGYPCGQVGKIQPGVDFVTVELLVSDEIVLHSGTTAAITIEEVLSGKLVELYPGKGEPLPAGTLLATKPTYDFAAGLQDAGNVAATFHNGVLDTVLINVQKITEQLIALSDKETAQSVASGLKKALDQINLVLADVSRLKLTEKSSVALTSFTATSDSIRKLSGTAKKFISSVEQFTSHADTVLTDMEHFLSGGNQLIAEINTISSSLKSDSTLAGKLINSPEFADKMDSLVDELELTLKHIRNKKVHVSLSLSDKEKKSKE